LLVWGGLVSHWFITEIDRNDGSITEIFFFLYGACWGSWRVLVWVGGALQKFSFYLGGVLGLGGRLFGLEEHYRNYSLSLIFCYGKKKKTSFLFTCS
jgi:hypothetical protein